MTQLLPWLQFVIRNIAKICSPCNLVGQSDSHFRDCNVRCPLWAVQPLHPYTFLFPFKTVPRAKWGLLFLLRIIQFLLSEPITSYLNSFSTSPPSVYNLNPGISFYYHILLHFWIRAENTTEGSHGCLGISLCELWVNLNFLRIHEEMLEASVKREETISRKRFYLSHIFRGGN